MATLEGLGVEIEMDFKASSRATNRGDLSSFDVGYPIRYPTAEWE